jgi:hypothetical protein
VNCGNGTVTDTVTGLIWLQQADCLANATYSAANQAAAGLKAGDCSLADGSSPGDWRLPTKDEWSAMIARAVAWRCTFAGPGTAPSLTNDLGAGMLPGNTCYGNGSASSFAGVASESYWSSTADDVFPQNAWRANLGDGNLGIAGRQGNTLRVWPVRGGK